MFENDADWKNDIFWRAVHIEGKEDGLERRLDFQDKKLNKILMRLGEENQSLYDGKEKYSHKSFAQNGEDVLIFNLFQRLGYNKPSFIDIGAHHPYNISNTAVFHLNGCKGVNIEANPNLIEEFYKERPNDINICSGVGGYQAP